GCASVICSDKTGTMTQNKMTVTRLWTGGNTFSVSGSGYEPSGRFYKNERSVKPEKQSDIRMLLQFGMLCNHAEIVHERGQYRLEGDPTEGAMVVAGMKAGFNKRSLLNDYTILQEFPFDSTRKRMTVIVEAKNGDRFAITKGAPDVLLGLSSFIFVGGRKEVLSGKWEKEV